MSGTLPRELDAAESEPGYGAAALFALRCGDIEGAAQALDMAIDAGLRQMDLEALDEFESDAFDDICFDEPLSH